jgi:hypothetical protein
MMSILGKKGIPFRNGATVQNILDDYLPGEHEDFQGYVLWNMTGWPCFFDHGEDSLRLQLAVVRWRLDNCMALPEDDEPPHPGGRE